MGRKGITPQADENTAWMKSCGFMPVLDVLNGGYTKGLDLNTEYQFMRVDWDAPEVFKLAECHPAMNVWGLYYRPSSKGRAD